MMSDEPELFALVPRRRGSGGRPRTAEPMAAVATRLPAAEYDALIRMAARADVSVNELLRRIVRREVQRRAQP